MVQNVTLISWKHHCRIDNVEEHILQIDAYGPHQKQDEETSTLLSCGYSGLIDDNGSWFYGYKIGIKSANHKLIM